MNTCTDNYTDSHGLSYAHRKMRPKSWGYEPQSSLILCSMSPLELRQKHIQLSWWPTHSAGTQNTKQNIKWTVWTPFVKILTQDQIKTTTNIWFNSHHVDLQVVSMAEIRAWTQKQKKNLPLQEQSWSSFFFHCNGKYLLKMRYMINYPNPMIKRQHVWQTG